LRLAAVPKGPVPAKSDDRDTSPPALASADSLVAAEFAYGPQHSIHTQAEQQIHIQQDLAAAGYSDSRAIQPAALSSLDGLSAAAVAAANEETSRVNRVDIYKAIAISGITCVLAGILDHDWVESHLVSFWASGVTLHSTSVWEGKPNWSQRCFGRIVLLAWQARNGVQYACCSSFVLPLLCAVSYRGLLQQLYSPLHLTGQYACCISPPHYI
jgi:hypothetical protein